jgi:hypothetical protein
MLDRISDLSLIDKIDNGAKSRREFAALLQSRKDSPIYALNKMYKDRGQEEEFADALVHSFGLLYSSFSDVAHSLNFLEVYANWMLRMNQDIELGLCSKSVFFDFLKDLSNEINSYIYLMEESKEQLKDDLLLSFEKLSIEQKILFGYLGNAFPSPYSSTIMDGAFSNSPFDVSDELFQCFLQLAKKPILVERYPDSLSFYPELQVVPQIAQGDIEADRAFSLLAVLYDSETCIKLYELYKAGYYLSELLLLLAETPLDSLSKLPPAEMWRSLHEAKTQEFNSFSPNLEV